MIITSNEVENNSQSYLVHCLTIIFGFAPLIGLAALKIQVPFLIEIAPEGWTLSSHVSFTVQLAAFLPILYTIFQKFSKRKVKESHAVYGVFIIAIAATLLAIFSIRKTIFLIGMERSLPAFIVTFLIGTAAYSSGIICLPYMGGRFRKPYMYSFLLGEALSGVFPSFLGFLQGTFNNDGIHCNNNITLLNSMNTSSSNESVNLKSPLFTSEIFFAVIFLLLLLSLICFICLDNLKVCESQHLSIVVLDNDYDKGHLNISSKKISNRTFYWLLILSLFSSVLVTGFPATIHPYSTLPYGSDTLQLAAILVLLANPAAPIISYFLKNESILAIQLLSLFATVLVGYLVAAAAMSPTPIFHGTFIGKCMVLLVEILKSFCENYVRICTATLLRARGGKSLMYYGGVMQVGISVGITFGFILVNFTNLFRRMDIDNC